MNFKKKKYSIIITMAAAMIIAGIGLAMPNDSFALKLCALLAIGCAIAALILYFKNGKCSYCGKSLLNGVFYYKECPFCHRNLFTGEERKIQPLSEADIIHKKD